jgi:hypothetical protein
VLKALDETRVPTGPDLITMLHLMFYRFETQSIAAQYDRTIQALARMIPTVVELPARRP